MSWLTWLTIAAGVLLAGLLAWLYTRPGPREERTASIAGGSAGAFALTVLLAWLAGDYLMTRVSPALSWVDVAVLYVLGLAGGLLLALLVSARRGRRLPT